MYCRFVSPPAYTIGLKYDLPNAAIVDLPLNHSQNIGQPTKPHGVSFALSQRQSQAQQFWPGPADYTVNTGETSRTSVFTKAKRGQIFEEQLPGPGDYDLTQASKQKAVSFKGGCDYQVVRSEGSQKFYQLSQIKTKIPISFSKAVRQNKSITNNSSNCYNNLPISYFQQQPKYSFSKSSRPSIKQKSKVPGPGFYFPQAPNKKLSVKIPTSQRNLKTGREDYPGPGAYQLKLKFKIKGPAYHQNHLLKQSAKQSPGPGHYNISSNYINQKPVSFTQGEKGIFTTAEQNRPGPGSYDTKLNRGVSFTIPKFTNYYNRLKQFPSPFTYQISQKASLKKVYGPKFGKAKRTNSLPAYNPGPGSYNIDVANNNLTQTFSNQQRGIQAQASASPGPGAYNIPPFFQEVALHQKKKMSNNRDIKK